VDEWARLPGPVVSPLNWIEIDFLSKLDHTPRLEKFPTFLALLF